MRCRSPSKFPGVGDIWTIRLTTIAGAGMGSSESGAGKDWSRLDSIVKALAQGRTRSPLSTRERSLECGLVGDLTAREIGGKDLSQSRFGKGIDRLSTR